MTQKALAALAQPQQVAMVPSAAVGLRTSSSAQAWILGTAEEQVVGWNLGHRPRYSPKACCAAGARGAVNMYVDVAPGASP